MYSRSLYIYAWGCGGVCVTQDKRNTTPGSSTGHTLQSALAM